MSVFKTAPPLSVVKEILVAADLTSDFLKPFEKSELQLTNTEYIATLLYPYYHESKALIYLDNLTPERYITVLRQLLLPNGYILEGKDTTIKGKHKTVYQIKPLSSATNLTSAVTIGFN